MKSKVQLFCFIFVTSMTFVWTRDNSLYSPNDPIIQPAFNEFEDLVHSSESVWVVEFYAVWCGHCQRFASTYKMFADQLKGWSPVVKVAAIACSETSYAPLCRHYDINEYPTIKMFPPHAVQHFKGHKYNGAKSVIDMRTMVLKYISTLLKMGVQSIDWPQLNQTRYTNHLWANNETELTLVIVEDQKEEAVHVGLMVILDFIYARPRLMIGRMSLEQASAYGITNSSLHRTTKLGIMLPVEFSGKMNRTDLGKTIRNLFNNNNNTTTLTHPTSTTATPTTVIPTIKHDGLHMRDLESNLRYSFWMEIPAKSLLNNYELQTLKNYYLPVKRHVKNFLNRTNQWLKQQNQTPFKTERWLQHLSSIEDSDSFIPADINWTGCRGSAPHLRGYPCSLWMTFHSVTVGGFLNEIKNITFDPRHILSVIRDYVKYFFGCKECSKNFANESAGLEQEAKDRKDSVLWLWRVHNRVNRRLHEHGREDPVYPKIQFPSHDLCPLCRHTIAAHHQFSISDDHWIGDSVLTYLLSYYSVDSLVEDHHSHKGSSQQPESMVKNDCVVHTTDWSPCSKSCDSGISVRLSNRNDKCENRLETRICMLRPCDVAFPDWSRTSWQQNNCPRVGHTYRLAHPASIQYSNCTTATSNTWHVCGICPPVNGKHVCCYPANSTTKEVEISCTKSDGSTASGKTMLQVIQYCECSASCSV